MNELNVDRLAKALSDILSRKYDAKITVTFKPKDATLPKPEPEQGR